MSAKSQQVTKSIQIDAQLAPVLDLMLKKANITINDIGDSFIKVWINQNLDLLTEAVKKKFKLKTEGH